MLDSIDAKYGVSGKLSWKQRCHPASRAVAAGTEDFQASRTRSRPTRLPYYQNLPTVLCTQEILKTLGKLAYIGCGQIFKCSIHSNSRYFVIRSHLAPPFVPPFSGEKIPVYTFCFPCPRLQCLLIENHSILIRDYEKFHRTTLNIPTLWYSVQGKVVSW